MNTLNINFGNHLLVYTFYKKEKESKIFNGIKNECHIAKSYMTEQQAKNITISKDYISFTVASIDNTYYEKSKLLMSNTFYRFGCTVNDYFDVTLTVIND